MSDLKRALKSGNTGGAKITGFARLAVPSVNAPTLVGVYRDQKHNEQRVLATSRAVFHQ